VNRVHKVCPLSSPQKEQTPILIAARCGSARSAAQGPEARRAAQGKGKRWGVCGEEKGKTVTPDGKRALKRDAIKDGKIYVKRTFSENQLRETTKTGDIRAQELTPYAQEIIDGLKRIGSFLFVRHDGKPYTNKNLNDIWRTACEKAKIKIKLYNAIRHGLGCQLLDEGHDLSLVQEVLGHRRQEMTRRYAKRTAKKIGQELSMRRQTCGRVAVEKILQVVDITQ